MGRNRHDRMSRCIRSYLCHWPQQSRLFHLVRVVPLYCCFRAQFWRHLLANERRNLPDTGEGSRVSCLHVRELGRQSAGERYLSLAGQCDWTVGNLLALRSDGRVGFRLLSEMGTRDEGQEPGRDRGLLGATALPGTYNNEWS